MHGVWSAPCGYTLLLWAWIARAPFLHGSRKHSRRFTEMWTRHVPARQWAIAEWVLQHAKLVWRKLGQTVQSKIQQSGQQNRNYTNIVSKRFAYICKWNSNKKSLYKHMQLLCSLMAHLRFCKPQRFLKHTGKLKISAILWQCFHVHLLEVNKTCIVLLSVQKNIHTFGIKPFIRCHFIQKTWSKSVKT